MDTKLFERFAPVIQSLNDNDLNSPSVLKAKLLLAKEGDIEICYAPFEYVNDQAKVVIVGITPGQTQMVNAIREARTRLRAGDSHHNALIAAKQTGAFSGAMRPNLIALLDSIGLQHWLRIESCGELLGTGSARSMVQTTSVLRNPVFAKGQNYNGTPNMTKNVLLRQHLLEHFGQDAKALPQAVFVPLGDKVSEALHFIADKGLIDRARILDGLPHPSGANAERIAYFLGTKARQDLSVKTDPLKLDQAKAALLSQVAAMA